MAEVIATFAALSSFLQVIEVTARVIKHAHRLVSSGTTALSGDVDVEVLAQEYRSLSVPAVTNNPSPDPHEQAVGRVRHQCQEEANKLLKQLEALVLSRDVTGAKRIKEGTRKALKAVTERKKIDQRRRHLQEFNALLATSLLQCLLSKHEAPVTQALDSLPQPADTSSHSIGEEQHEGSKPEHKILWLAKSHEEALNRRNHNLLNSLSFDEMKKREDYITDAYPATYKWALEDEALGLRTWLHSGNGLYWISGKAGSGKSTLMKFLCTSPHTQRLLDIWNEGYPVAFATFYFYYLGTKMQKSTIGLLRSILHQVLSHRIQWAPVAFPEYYGSIVHTDGKATPHWTCSELIDGLHRIAKHDVNRHHCEKFCFFIDGLDEYYGSHLELIRLLYELAEHPDFKLCVSSRPWTAFRNAYETKVPNLRLEQLTRPDIKYYVEDRIYKACCCAGDVTQLIEADITTLVDDIVNRAEGVFLWVFLVVKSVLDGLGETDNISFLRRRVLTFPSDLEEFFENILRRVDPVYRCQSSQALRLAQYSMEETRLGKLSNWLHFWLIKQDPQGLANPQFVHSLEPTRISRAALMPMIRETQVFLSATCKDLLWIPTSDIEIEDKLDFAESLLWAVQVHFLHRTVYDFLCTEHINRILQSQTPTHFKSLEVYYHLNLARLKFTQQECSHEYSLELTRSLEDTGHELILQKHLGPTETLVRELEDIALWYRRLHKCVGVPDCSCTMSCTVFSGFAAFHCSRYILDLLREATHSASSSELHIRCSKIINDRAFASAIFGESDINKFELDRIDTVLVDQVLTFATLPTSSYGAGALSLLWHLFLSKFAMCSQLVSYRQEPEVEIQALLLGRLEHAWCISKLFLERYVTVDEEFFPISIPDKTNHLIHTTASVREFLIRVIPLEWRVEFGDERLIDDS